MTRYLETRGRIHHSPSNLAADVMRHLHARLHLGQAVVVSDDPAELLALAYRQWLKLSRTLQKRRGAASNAVEILKYTYTITQMQHLVFSTRIQTDAPDTAVCFLGPSELTMLPPHPISVYIVGAIPSGRLAGLVAQLPANSLVVDYSGQLQAGDFGLHAKADLEVSVLDEWSRLEQYMTQLNVKPAALVGGSQPADAIDDALDTMLGDSPKFLAAAGAFQRALDLARPLRTISKAQREQFEALMMLAHRVQTLAPSGFSVQFLNTYADDTFFLSDRLFRKQVEPALIERQRRAGRLALAEALAHYRPTGRQWLMAA